MPSPTKPSAVGTVLCYFILLLIGILAFSIRLFSVVKYESVIHEFDPYFNYRVAQFLSRNGIFEFWNWFDPETWYPLGRVIGGTVYPGLSLTAYFMWKAAHAINIPLTVETVCVFTAPVFSAFCAWATFLLTKEVRGPGAGLCAAAFIAIVPSYISRSVAGSYDNEGVAIFALVYTFYFYVKTLNTGSLFYATCNALAYFYMVCSWGGYTFIINIIPIHVLMCLVTGRYSSRLYIAFAPLLVLGTLLAALVPVVGFNAVMTSEHFGGFLVFVILNVTALVFFMKGILPEKTFAVASYLVVSAGVVCSVGLAAVMVFVVAASPTLGWSGRSLSLLDPTYASKYIPIIASVSEHQPPMWTSYFMDIQALAFLAPAGIVACFLPLTDTSSFLALYLVTAVYFSGVMVRLMLVLAPAACILSGVALSEAFFVLTRSLKFLNSYQYTVKHEEEVALAALNATAAASTSATTPIIPNGTEERKSSKKPPSASLTAAGRAKEKALAASGEARSKRERKVERARGAGRGGLAEWYRNSTDGPMAWEMAVGGLLLLLYLCFFYVIHSTWTAAEAYSAPSIVLASRHNGELHVFDDFRESYAWLRHNTATDAKVASWWDYGYQTTAMANRTVIVDNNTWNNTHIATVGMAMSSPEKEAWEIYRSLDVEYVFVIFGGLIGYSSDDINKFLWMVRIGGGVFPHIKEPNYLNNGNYRIDKEATPTMLNCLMYKLSYYRYTEATGGSGYDRVRNAEIGRKHFKLTHFEEVFTSQHWMVRIYRLKDPKNRIRGKNKLSKSKGKSVPKK